jgi:UDP-glucose 4-epimerase
MRVLVTGGKGFIGSYIVKKYISLGAEVVVIDDESAPENENFYSYKGASYHKKDIRDPSTLPLYKNVDYVFHCAARSRIQPSLEDPCETFSINVSGTQKVLYNSYLQNVKKVIYSSSSSCYGFKNSPPFKEDMDTDCKTPYSLSKKQGEDICNLYSNLYGMSTIILRYFNVYGQNEPTKGIYAPVIGLFKKQMEENNGKVTIVGDGEQRRDFTHINDVVTANVLAANSKIFNDTFNIGTGRNYSINDIAAMLDAARMFIPPRAGEARATLADISKASQILGWNPTVSLDDVILNYEEIE